MVTNVEQWDSRTAKEIATSWNDNQRLVEDLKNSKFYRDYECAFREAIGLPISLIPAESHAVRSRGAKNPSELSGLKAVLQDQASYETASAVPVHIGEQLIGFLQTGRIPRKENSARQLDFAVELSAEWIEENSGQTENSGGDSLSAKRHRAALKILSTFGEHISMVANQIVVRRQNSDSPVVRKAKDFIQQHLDEKLSLAQVAKAVNTSPFHFCKLFKKSTGLHFTEYVSRLRIEKACELLLNPNIRICEICYGVGFRCMPHFNRIFKKIRGQSPTEFRARLPFGPESKAHGFTSSRGLRE